MAGWDTDYALELAWLGALGEEEEEAADAFLEECAEGEHGEDAQEGAGEMLGRLEAYLETDQPIGEELREKVLAEGDAGTSEEGDEVDPDELSAAEAREIARAQEDEGTAQLAAIVEELADRKGGELTPAEISTVVDRVGLGLLEGQYPSPDVIRELGSEVTDRSDRQTRAQRGAEAIEALKGEADGTTVHAEEVGGDKDRADRLERGALAVAALRAADDDGGADAGGEDG